MKKIALLLSVSIAGAALAGPAPYYQWRSKLNGVFACSQTPLGPGWEKTTGPYRDARCEKLMIVK